MPPARENPRISDSQREARKYHQLLLAIERAAGEAGPPEEIGQPNIDVVLGHLLPDLCGALGAQQAFVAVTAEDGEGGKKSLELSAVYPDAGMRGRKIGVSGLVERLMRDGRPVVIDPLDDESPDPLPGLEIFNAVAAILVCTHGLAQTRVLGLCNKLDPERDSFLAPDGKMLDDIVQLIAIGARAGERHAQELRSIQETSRAVSTLLELDQLLPEISAQAARVFHAPATSVMLWDETRENFVIKAGVGLSDAYKQEQRIPASRVWPEIQRLGTRPLLTRDLRHTPYGRAELIEREDLGTVLTAPLLVGQELIGLLNIYSKHQPREFTADQAELVSIYANQVAVAVHNAELYEALKHQSEHWQALHEASKTISEGFMVQQERVLDIIVEEAVERLSVVRGPRPASGIIQTYNQATNELQFKSVYPPGLLPALTIKVGERRSLDRSLVHDGRIGITGRTVLEKHAERVRDVRTDPDYLMINPNTRAELAVPLLDGARVIGVLSLEAATIGAFDQDDEQALTALAELAVIAIKNGEQADQLSRANAVAMLGAWGADIAHDVNREVGNIRRAIYLLRQRPKIPPDIKEQLQEVDGYAGRLATFALPEHALEPGRAVRAPYTASLDGVVQAELQSFERTYPHISWKWQLDCPKVQVAMHEQWLRRLLRHLLRNAASALPEDSTGTVTVRTSLEDSRARVEVEDTGKGVGPETESLLFRRPIPHQGAQSGRGLLLARFLAEQHGGEIHFRQSQSAQGACFWFTVPITATS
jgi:GAF domain-containing protein